GVARGGSVDAGGRLHDQPLHGGGLLAGGQQLHGPQDVDVLLHHPAPGVPGGGDDAHVDDRVDLGLGHEPAHERAADVGTDELRAPDGVARGEQVDADDPLERGVLGEAPDDAPGQVAGDTGDHDDPRHATSWGGSVTGADHDPESTWDRRRPRRRPLDGAAVGGSLLVATLVTRLAQQLAVLLLRHPLAALLDHRAHWRTVSFVSEVVERPDL